MTPASNTRQNFIESITSDSMRARLEVMRSQRPEIDALCAIMQRGPKFYEWAHTIGVTTDDELRSIAPPVPPFRVRIIGAARPEPLFLWTGIKDADAFVGHFRRYSDPRARSRVLDFGCGCGRVMRFLSQSTEFNVSGADINQDNVSWCQSNLPAVRTIQTSALPPFAFVANEFDLVFAISVFTHLPKVAMFAWLDEISRVTVSGGVVILTTHGDAVLDTITKSPQHQKMFRMSSEDASSMKAKFSSDGFVYNSYDADGLRVAKAGSDYGTSFTHEKFIRSQWNRDALSVIEFLPGGLRGGQDIVILKKA